MLKFTKQKIQMKITIVTLYSHQSLENETEHILVDILVLSHTVDGNMMTYSLLENIWGVTTKFKNTYML